MFCEAWESRTTQNAVWWLHWVANLMQFLQTRDMQPYIYCVVYFKTICSYTFAHLNSLCSMPTMLSSLTHLKVNIRKINLKYWSISVLCSLFNLTPKCIATCTVVQVLFQYYWSHTFSLFCKFPHQMHKHWTQQKPTLAYSSMHYIYFHSGTARAII